MRVFVTGATGWIGSAVTAELLEAGHEVTGLARSEQSATKLHDRGIDVVRGGLQDLDTLQTAAADADGIIHTAYNHDDFNRFAEAAALNRRAIEAFATVLEDTDKPLVFSSGTGFVKPGELATETDLPPMDSHPRAASEYARVEMAAKGIRVSSVRHPPTVHGEGDRGFVAILTKIAKDSGVSGYVGDGSNRWPAVHVLDAAPLYLSALTQAPAGAVLNSVAEEGIPTREIAEAIGRALGVPTQSVEPSQAADHFGFLATFFGRDVPASSALTRARYGWRPTHPGLLDDLNAGHYTREISTAGTPAGTTTAGGRDGMVPLAGSLDSHATPTSRLGETAGMREPPGAGHAMNVMFASEVLVPAVGGAERTMLEWAQGLRERGHAVQTVSLPPAPRPAPERYWRWRGQQREQLGRLVAAAVAARPPDVVVAQLHGAPAALAAAARAGVPGVLAVPSYEGLCKLAFLPGSDCPADGDCVKCPSAARLARAERSGLAASRDAHEGALSQVDALVTPSVAVARTVRRWVGRGSTVVWPVGPELPARARPSRQGPVVCAASRWLPHKGAALLPALVAASRATGHGSARAVHVTDVGLGTGEREAITAAGGTLVPAAPIGELVDGASVVLVPSQWEEPFGRIAWEALARGVPVLASDAGGLAECVPAELLVAPRDRAGAWASAIDRLVGDPAVWTAAAASGRDHATRLIQPPPLDRLEQLLAAVTQAPE